MRVALVVAGRFGQVLFRYLIESGEQVPFTALYDGDDCSILEWLSSEGIAPISFEDFIADNLLEKEEFELLLAAGPDISPVERERLFNLYSGAGFRFRSYIHPSNCISPSADLAEGCILLERNTILPNASVGKNVFIGSNSVIGNNTVIGEHCCVGSGAVIAGYSKVGCRCEFGLNSSAVTHLEVGNDCFVGDNAVVLRSIGDNMEILAAPSIVHTKKAFDVDL